MADISPGGSSKSKSPKTNKKSTKIDMTAMVDVAFLLLTFFVLTATISDNNALGLLIPPDADSKKIIQDKIMTIVLDESDRVLYYTGIENIVVKPTDFSDSGIRLAIMEHLSGDGTRPLCVEVDNQGKEQEACWDPIFVIKAKPKSRYRNLVDILDEIKLLQAPKYALDDYTREDSIRIAQAVESSLAAQ